MAHIYGTYSIPVEGVGEVRLLLSWKDGAAAHMKWAASAGVVDGHGRFRQLLKGEPPAFIVVDCGSLWRDLDALFSSIDAKLAIDPAAQTQFRARVAANRTYFTAKLSGSDAELWKDLIASRRFEVEG